LDQSEITIQMFVFPTSVDLTPRQTVVSAIGSGASWTLSLRGSVLELSPLEPDHDNASTISLDTVVPRAWHLVALSFSPKKTAIRVWRYDRPFTRSAPFAYSEVCVPRAIQFSKCPTSLIVGAGTERVSQGGDTKVQDGFDGKIGSLLISGGWSSADEVIASVEPQLDAGQSTQLLGRWDFSDTRNLSVRNALAPNEVGKLINAPTTGVTGASWDGTCQQAALKPEHYDAIHFHSDDIFDCGWSADFSWTLPSDLESGLYAVKLVNEAGDHDHLPIFVCPAAQAPRNRVALMLPTMTYMAYSNERMQSENLGFDVGQWSGQVALDERLYNRIAANPSFGGSLYDCHKDGSGRHFASWLRPLLSMRPDTMLWTLSADLQIMAWLDREGISFDLITDHLVHDEGVEILERYGAIISGNHPEYVTRQIVEAIEDYTWNRGGRFLYMGGNGYYWVTGVPAAAPEAIEVRRGVAGSGAWQSRPGEHFLSSTGELGGLWRHLGRAPQQVFGVGTRGMGFPGSVGYALRPDWDDPRVRFLVAGVTDAVLGDYGVMGGGAAGEETDATDFNLGTPSHALIVARSCNHPEGMMLAREDQNFPVPEAWTRHRVSADLTFFETPSGGAMLSVGSMAWCGSLAHNNYQNGIAQLTRNALDRFVDPTPFAWPSSAPPPCRGPV
jgi:N,N-dimethylformamidase